ncbi:MAG: PLL family lectin [Candidatus Dormibacteria bacterium]
MPGTASVGLQWLPASASSAPAATTSYYEDSASIAPCAAGATWNCAPWAQGFEVPVAPGGSMVILDLGAPCIVPNGGALGTQLFDENTCTAMSDETVLVRGFLGGYEAGHGGGTPPLVLAVGVSNSLTAADPQLNYALSQDQLTAHATAFYTTLVAGMGVAGPAPVWVWGANDIEQSSSGNWYGPGPTRAWVDAFGAAAHVTQGKPVCAAGSSGMLADFGDDVVGAGGWQAADIYHVAYGAPVACSVPEIYYTSMAGEWASLNRWATQNGLPTIQFTSVLSEDGADGTLSAAASYDALTASTGQSAPYLSTIRWSSYLGWNGAASLGDGPLGGAPQVASWGPGNEDIFWRGTDGGLWHAWTGDGGSTWQGPQSLGGSLAGPPSVVSWGVGHFDVFWRGTDGALWHSYYVNGWHGPERLGGAPMGSDPSAVTDAVGSIHVYWEGTDRDLWEMTYANGWSGPWGRRSGPLGLPPHAVARGPGEVTIVWQGTDHNLWRDDLSGGAYAGPTGIATGGNVAGAPMAASWGGGHADVFWPGSNGGIWHAWVMTAGGAWSGPSQLTSASVAPQPLTPVAFSFGHLAVFWEDTSNNLWTMEFANAWTAPADLGDGPLGSRPTAVVRSNLSADVFWQGADASASLWHDWHG